MFYPNIAAERARRKLTVDDLAKECGVTRKTFYNWELHGNIPLKALITLADLFHCTIDYLAEVTE